MPKAKGSGKKGTKGKKKAVEIPAKYPIDIEKLQKVDTMLFIGTLESKPPNVIKVTLPMDYTFHKLKEIIQEHHGHSCGELKLYMPGAEKRDLESLMYQSFSSLKLKGEKFEFVYEFQPFNHPMLLSTLV